MVNKLTISYINTSFGYWLTSFLIPLIVLQITGSALTVSISYALNILPYIFITPFSGVICDIINRKKIIAFGEIICSMIAIILFFTPFNNQYQNFIIFSGFLISSFSAIHHPVFQAIIPDIFSAEKIKEVNSAVGIIDSLVSIIAPALLGVILTGLSKKNMLLVVAFCYLFSFIMICRIKYTKTTPEQKLNIKNIFNSLKEGFHYVFTMKSLRNISILFFFVNIGIRVIFPNLIWIYTFIWHLNDNAIAINFLIIGIGAMIGARLAKYIIGKVNDLTIIVTCSFFISLCSLLLLLAGNAYMHALIWALSSLFQSVIVVTFFTYRQKITESRIMGRVVSVTRLISYLAIPVASISSGWIINNSGKISNIYLISCGVTLFSLALFGFLQKNRRIKSF